MKKRKRYLKQFLLAVACLLFLVSGVWGCTSNEKSKDTEESYIWYLAADKNSVEKMEYEISGKTTEDQVEQMLKDLATVPEKKDYVSLFQKGISVLDWKLEDEKLDLNFNSAYHDMKPSEELIFRYFVVRSLCQMKGVSYVAFFVENDALKDAENQNVGYMNRDSFVQNIGMSLHNYQSQEFVLYYANEEGNALIKETRQVRYNSNKSKEKVIIEELQKSSLKNTKLLGISVRDDICYVNFDGEFLEEYGAQNPEVTIYSIVNSLVENKVADEVQISVNGSTDVKYQDIVDLTRPLEFNENLIKK